MKNKIAFYIILLGAVLVIAQTQAASINFDDTWATDLNGSSATTTVFSATAGTNAAVSFDIATGASSFMAGGVYNSFTPVTLGVEPGSFISLKFMATFVGGATTNLKLKFSFGLAGANDKLFALLGTGLATATPKFNLGAYVNDANTVTKGSIYRGDVNALVTNIPTTTYTGAFTNGPDATVGTYTLSLTRTATGADLIVSQAKINNNWTSTTRTLTAAEANAITLDKVFIGINGSNGGGDFIYTVSNLSVQVYIQPIKRVSLSVLTSPN